MQKLETKMHGTKGDLKKKIRSKIEELSRLKESTNQRVIEIHHSGENTREGLKSGTDRTFNILNDSIHSALDEFKN